MSQYTDEFKKQIVNLYNNEKSPSEIMKEYKIARSTLHKWVKDYNGTQSFKAKDNRSLEEIELLALKKELTQLRMENDILKQAALIMGRR
ncbi:MAG: transposase [Eubacteriaceae bacterium]|jgi:transposase|nr:transposase [Eubacteriaceae bacterium]